jgi:hypothetical protein
MLPAAASCRRSCTSSSLILARHHHHSFHNVPLSSSLSSSSCLHPSSIRLGRAFAAKASSGSAAAASASPSSSSSPSSAPSEPLRTLDDVTFTYTAPVIEPEEDVKGAKRRAAQERAKSKMERGKKRQEERMAKLRTQGQQKIDYSDILPEDNPVRTHAMSHSTAQRYNSAGGVLTLCVLRLCCLWLV